MQGWAACTGSDTCYYSVGCRAHIYLVCKYNYAVHHSKQIRQLNVQVESLIAFYLQYLESSVLPALPTCRDLQQLNIEDCSVSRPVAYSLQDNTDTRPLGDFINHNSFPLISPPRVQHNIYHSLRATSDLSPTPRLHGILQTYRDPGTSQGTRTGRLRRAELSNHHAQPFLPPLESRFVILDGIPSCPSCMICDKQLAMSCTCWTGLDATPYRDPVNRPSA